MIRTRAWLSLCVVVAAPVAAFAHGGATKAPAPDPMLPKEPMPSGGSGAPQVPPGTADLPAAVTRWETWWAHNKEFFLRLAEQMRVEVGPTSRGLSGEKPKSTESPQAVRARMDEAVREMLVQVFIDALDDESFEVRTSAAIALGKTGSKDGAKALREASVKDKHKDVRDSAVLGLGLLGDPGDIPFLLKVLRDDKENQRHRSFAAFALGLIGGEDAATALLIFADGEPDRPSTFAHEQPPLVASTFVAMGLTGDPRVLPSLREALANPKFDDAVRAFVVLSLGRMKDRDSLGEIGRMLVVEKDSGLRRSAAIALGKIATADDQAAVEALVAAAKGAPDEMIRQFSAISLGGIADAKIKARLEKMFDDAPTAGRPFVALAMAIAHDAAAAPILRDALRKETDESTKASYCISLALLGDEESAPLMEKQVEDRGRVWLQGYAAVSLGMIHHVQSADMLSARLASENDPRLRANLSVALGLMHDPRAKTYLLNTLRQKDATIYERGGAAMAMGVLRMDEAATAIVEVYRNKKEQDMVRAFAVVSLGLLADPSPVPKLARFSIDNNYTLTVDPLNEVMTIL
jgi:HEAT repeat protein